MYPLCSARRPAPGQDILGYRASARASKKWGTFYVTAPADSTQTPPPGLTLRRAVPLSRRDPCPHVLSACNRTNDHPAKEAPNIYPAQENRLSCRLLVRQAPAFVQPVAQGNRDGENESTRRKQNPQIQE